VLIDIREFYIVRYPISSGIQISFSSFGIFKRRETTSEVMNLSIPHIFLWMICHQHECNAHHHITPWLLDLHAASKPEIICHFPPKLFPIVTLPILSYIGKFPSDWIGSDSDGFEIVSGRRNSQAWKDRIARNPLFICFIQCNSIYINHIATQSRSWVQGNYSTTLCDRVSLPWDL
jgi:hypothetical protein